MQLQCLPETGSHARFFNMVVMYLVVAALAFCLIAAAYADEMAADEMAVEGSVTGEPFTQTMTAH
jgi:hypothetical protein